LSGVIVFSEPGLFERFRAGNEAALETVYWACVGDVSRIADAVLRACAAGSARGTGEIATVLADVVQEVFVKAFAPEARQRFDPGRPYRPYLAQITRNVAVDHWRQMRRYVPSDIEQLIDRLSLEAEADSADAGAWSDAETVALVNRYVGSLDEDSRRVHEALYVKGMSQRDAADALGLGRQTIRTAEAKLRAGLRRELSRAGRVMAVPLPSMVGKQSG
jgi:RNA polymerase sigma-70 factor (ECF subfamily)